MKKLIALLLALAMLLSVAACGKKQTPAEPEVSENTEPEPVEEPVEEDPSVPLPKVGDKVEGFTAKELRDFPLGKGDLVCVRQQLHQDEHRLRLLLINLLGVDFPFQSNWTDLQQRSVQHLRALQHI